MSAFASAAPYYARYRPAYPSEVFELLVNRFGLDRTQTALDLGCGTGAVAIPLAPLVGSVIAVDPEPAMLAEAQRAAHQHVTQGIQWRLGNSANLGELNLPPIHLCTMGKSFHWMNQSQVLADLDGVITSHGGVVLLSGAHTADRPAWLTVIDEVATSHLGPDYRRRHGPARHPAEERESTLARSPFSHVETTVVPQHFHRTLDELVGLQFSFSYSSPHVLSTKKTRFEQDLRAALLDFDPAGIYRNTVHIECTVATRP
ncbi:class I SAM-dependent methyltransferase [Streptomyces sp. NPDC056144]|uniref:class I SAM-dependent methyltransferase n=1 Tax=unclassified Streptomyces TaxID=2593676 RepID=UPI0035DB50B3